MAAQNRRIGDQPWVRRSLIGLALAITLIMLVIPVVVIFTQALSTGWSAFAGNVLDEYTLDAIGLTLFVAALTVPLNLVFGTALAWSVTRFRFPGRKLLITLIDIPFAVSPVVAGLLYLAALWPERLARQLAEQLRRSVDVLLARHRDGHRIRNLSVCGQGADPLDAATRQRGGGSRRGAGRFRLADFSQDHTA